MLSYWLKRKEKVLHLEGAVLGTVQFPFILGATANCFRQALRLCSLWLPEGCRGLGHRPALGGTTWRCAGRALGSRPSHGPRDRRTRCGPGLAAISEMLGGQDTPDGGPKGRPRMGLWGPQPRDPALMGHMVQAGDTGHPRERPGREPALPDCHRPSAQWLLGVTRLVSRTKEGIHRRTWRCLHTQ